MISLHAKTKLKRISQQVRSLEKTWPKQLEIVEIDSPKMIEFLPYSLLDVFRKSPTKRELDFLASAQLIAKSILLFDSLMDHQQEITPDFVKVLRIQTLQHDGYSLLMKLFPSDSPFWNHFRQRLQEYINASLKEKQYSLGLDDWKKFGKEALSIAAGKAAIAHLIVDGLAILTNQSDISESLNNSLRHYYIGIQMIDDVQDWLIDIEADQPSLLLSCAVDNWPLKDKQEILSSEKAARVFRRQLYSGGHVTHVLDIANSEMEQAKNAVFNFQPSLWHTLLSDHLALCKEWLVMSHEIIGSVKKYM